MKYIKITVITLLILFVLLILVFHLFSHPKSNKKISQILGEDYIVDYKEYKDMQYRYFAPKNFDETKPTILFVHGSIGSLLDFKKLIKDTDMKAAYNMVSFDRPNYGDIHDAKYVHEIPFEAKIALDLLDSYTSTQENILVGYSYGGPIAMVAQFDDRIDKAVLVAPAVDPENEVIPFLIFFYKNKYTRFLVPSVWKEASKEKMKHAKDLKKIENLWKFINKPIIHIQGTKDSLVPYLPTAEFLRKNIKTDFYTHIPVPNKGHGFVFSQKDVFINYFLN